MSRMSTGVPWWMASVAVTAGAACASTAALILRGHAPVTGSAGWWVLTIIGHLPFVVIAMYLVGGLIERIGFLAAARAPREGGALPPRLPTVCVQVAMYNEEAVAARAIAAVCAMDWPRDLLEVQVLDDSTDPAARAVVDAAVASARRRGVTCHLIRRSDRTGYKAGALENGRRRTGAEFLAIFDADFLPAPSFLRRAIAHFYDRTGAEDPGLALVQAQWGHLNPDHSALTRAQALWVDDHHSVQMSWRSRAWRFVNFTGTAGVWRASAVERVGGWRAASLVEDCELSFRHLFAGYRTAFASDVVAPAELPATYTAYKAQQKRWTQGWMQLQRLHLATLVRAPIPWPRRAHLVYHMTIPWQWAAWMLWVLTLPSLIHLGLWFGVFGAAVGLAVYVVPTVMILVLIAAASTACTRFTYPTRRPRDILRRFGRVIPYAFVSAGMLPHQFSAFAEGALGSLHSEFERTPKTAGTARRQRVRVHWPYVLFEVFFIVYQCLWSTVFALSGLGWPAVVGFALATCVAVLLARYGDNEGRFFFVVESAAVGPRAHSVGAMARRALSRA